MSATRPAVSYLKPGVVWKKSGLRARGTIKILEVRDKHVLIQDRARQRIWVARERFFPKAGCPRRYIPIPDEQL